MSFSMSGSGDYSYNRFDLFEKKLRGCGEDCDCEKCGKVKKGKKGAKPDFLDTDKDGDKEEPMKDALKDKEEDQEEVAEGIDFKGAKRIDDARAKKQAEKDKKNPSGKDFRLALRKFRPGASNEERAEGHRDNMREKGTIPKKGGKDMFESLSDAYREVYGLGKTEDLDEAVGAVLASAAKALASGAGTAAKAGAKAAGNLAKGAAKGTAKAAGSLAKGAAKGAKSLGAEMVDQQKAAVEGEKEEVEEGYKPTNFEKNERQAYKHRKAEEDAVRKGDEEAANKHMKRRTALSSPLAKRTELINQGKGPANEMTRKSKLTKESLEAVGIFTEEEIEVILERLANKRIEKMGIQYPTGEKKKTSVAIRKEKEAAEKKEKAARSKSMKEAYSDMYMEVYKGKHGQDDKEYADSRSEGGKMISGDSKQSGAEYTHGRRVKAANPGMQPDVGGKTKPKSQGKMDKGTRADLEYRKANLKKEEVELEEGLFGKKMTDEEKAAKKRAKAADELERLHKHIKNPLSDINTSATLRKKMKEELEESGIFSEAEIEALLERNAEVEAQGKKIAELEKEGRAKGLTDKFRQEHPGSREEKKERGAKKSVGDVQADQREFHNKLQSKYGRTEKQKKEASIMSKHTSPRD